MEKNLYLVCGSGSILKMMGRNIVIEPLFQRCIVRASSEFEAGWRACTLIAKNNGLTHNHVKPVRVERIKKIYAKKN